MPASSRRLYDTLLQPQCKVGVTRHTRRLMEQGAPLGEKTEKFGHERPSNRNVIPLWTWYHLIQRMRKPGSGCTVPDDLVPKPVVGRRRARQNDEATTQRRGRRRQPGARRQQEDNANGARQNNREQQQRQQEENVFRQAMNLNVMNFVRQYNREQQQRQQEENAIRQARNFNRQRAGDRNDGQLNDPSERRRRRRALQNAFDNLELQSAFDNLLSRQARNGANAAPPTNTRPTPATRRNNNSNFWRFLNDLAPENSAALRPRQARPSRA